MFRRKEEDSLFDTPNQENSDAAAANSSSAPANASGAYSNPPVPPSQSRFPSDSRAPSSPAGNSQFRPSSIPSDLPRNRLPENKPASSAASGIISAPKDGKTVRRVLTVGSDILLKGEIATCDRLVIEGKVDATLNDVHTVEIAETGSFKGSAHIEDAEISGLFEGELVVRGRLVIYSTGKVRGKITYGEIEIERGGELSGEIKSGSQGAAASRSRSMKDEKVAA